MNKKKILWSFLILTYLSLLSQAMIDNTRSSAYPDFLSFFGVLPSLGSLVFSLSSFGGIITCMTSRTWLFYLGNLGAMRVGLAFVFSSALFYFVIPIYFFSFPLFLFFSFILGVGIGLLAIPMNILLGISVPSYLRQRAYSGLHAVYGLGSLMAPLLYGFWMAHGGKWPNFFLVLSFIPLVPLIYSCWIPAGQEPSLKKNALVPPVGVKLRIAVGAMFGFYVGSELLLSSRLVLYLQKELSFNLKNSQYYLSFFFLSLFLGRLVFAIVPLGIKMARAMMISLILSIFLMILGIHFSPIFLSLSGLTMACFFPLGMAWLLEKFQDGYEYMMGSIFTWVAIYLFVIHSLFGLMATYIGLKPAFHLAPALGMGTLILLLFLDTILGKDFCDESQSK